MKRPAELRFSFSKVEKLLLVLILCIVSLYGLNAAIIFFGNPMNVQKGHASVEEKDIGDLRLVSFDSLDSGGTPLPGFYREASGYVNMFSDEKTIYMDSRLFDESSNQGSTLYKHEYAHVLQKQMVAHAAGGYPSVSNLFTSLKYYVYLLKLDTELGEVMPGVVEEYHLPVGAGLEAAADCFAQPFSEVGADPVLYVGPYLEEKFCNAEQVRLAVSLISVESWFAPLSTEQLAKLKPVNIVTSVDVELFDSDAYLQLLLEDLIRSNSKNKEDVVNLQDDLKGAAVE